MKKLLSVLAVVLGLGMATMSAPEAEAAKRMGAGKSMGTQRQASPDKPAAAPTQNAAAGAAPAAAAKPNRSWMGPLAGIAAGLGLAALASHFGFGEELASIMMFALLAMVVMAAAAYFMRKRMANKLAPLGAGASGGVNPFQAGNQAQASTPAYKVEHAPVGGSMIGSGLGASASSIPADFDTAAFERNAKVNFIRLQAANDAGNLEDIRAFTTPQMFAELKMDLSERGSEPQKYEVNQIDARVLEVETQADSYVVSVRFTGTMHDSVSKTTDGFDEIWHLTKPRQGEGGWLLSGIQQMS